jgi:hypothetical protein
MIQSLQKEITKDHTAKPFMMSKDDRTKSKVNRYGQRFGVDSREVHTLKIVGCDICESTSRFKRMNGNDSFKLV